MAKLKLLSMHNIKNVPDHLIHEMQDFSIRLTQMMHLYIETVQPNIALAALNWAQACMLKYLVTNDPEELRKAAKMSCSILLNNMEILIKQMEDEEKNDI